MRRALVALVACTTAPSSLAVVEQPTLGGMRTSSPPIEIIERDDKLFVVNPRQIAIVSRDGTTVIDAPPGTVWERAAAVTSADFQPSSILAIASGALYGLDGQGQLVDVAEHYGVGHGRATEIVGASRTFAIATRDEVLASHDGLHLKRFRGTANRLAAAPTRIALARARHTEVFDLERATSTSYPVVATELGFLDAFGVSPRLVVRTAAGLLVERSGKLETIADARAVEQVAIAGWHIWIGRGSTLSIYDGKRIHPTTVEMPAGGRLYGSPSGDVWVVEGTRIRRFRLETPDESTEWARSIAPLFTKHCAPCHEPGGDSGIDLSTATPWREARSKIYLRTIVERSMPPEGTLSASELEILRAFLERH